MTIKADILEAKGKYNAHTGTHKCGELHGCPERSALWQAWMGAAKIWGQEPDDEQRMKEIYEKTFGSTPPAR